MRYCEATAGDKMRLSRSQILVLILLVLLIVAAYAAYVASGDLAVLSQQIKNGQMTDRVSHANSFVNFVWMALAAAVAFTALLVFPTVRSEANQSGQLEVMAKTLSEKSETYQQAALTDALTGLQNRRYFDDALAQYMEEFSRIGRPIGVMVIDLDHFKLVNDTHGHDVGDEVLRALGECLLQFTRYHDIVARLGGEEFAVVAPNLDLPTLTKLAERIRVAISKMNIETENVTLRVTASIGLASWDGVEDGNALLKRADEHLYQAKANGRNRVAA